MESTAAKRVKMVYFRKSFIINRGIEEELFGNGVAVLDAPQTLGVIRGAGCAGKPDNLVAS